MARMSSLLNPPSSSSSLSSWPSILLLPFSIANKIATFLPAFFVLLLSALFSFYISQFLFTRNTLVLIYKFQNWLLLNFGNLLNEREMAKMQKMYTLWSPPTHPFPYLATSFAINLALNLMSSSSSIGISTSSAPSCRRIIRNAFVLSFGITIWNLGAQRVGEIHGIVIALNLAHSMLLCTTIGLMNWAIIYVKWRRRAEEEKEKSE